ncbi:MAG: hemolysin XhlA family protein [Peptostreptococcaceae bacterium]|nr:hemolysin XhlA family protein [Peptostreptococcaceae bacterium]
MTGNSCNEKHANVIERLDRNESRLNKHSEEIDALKEKQSDFGARLELLIKSMENLNKAIWWLIGLGGTTLVSFLMRQIEKGLMGG